jgi:hypothetical protein
MLAAAHEAHRKRDELADSVPLYDRTRVVRGTLTAGDRFVFDDGTVKIGYSRSGNAVLFTFSPAVTATGGYADALIRQAGNHASTLEIWDGTATITAGGTYYFGSTDNATTAPTTGASTVVNLSHGAQVVRCRLGLGADLAQYYEAEFIIHEAAAAGQYDFLLTVVKRS